MITMDAPPLTTRQADALREIEDFMHLKKRAPSSSELAKCLGGISRQAADKLVQELAALGYVTERKGRKQSMKLTERGRDVFHVER